MDKVKVNDVLKEHIQIVENAITSYEGAVEALQKDCEHPVILKYTNSDYQTTRLCELCGYYERVKWDSSYQYKDNRLLGRAYDVTRTEILESHVKQFR